MAVVLFTFNFKSFTFPLFSISYLSSGAPPQQISNTTLSRSSRRQQTYCHQLLPFVATPLLASPIDKLNTMKMATFITRGMGPPNITQIRVKNIVTCLDAAVETLEIIAKDLETPFLQPISSTVRSLLSVKRNQDDCTRMLEHIHRLLYAIIRLHIDSDTGGELSPSMVKNLGQFTETLHKIHTFVDAQKEKSIIKQFFRQGEMSTLLNGCNDGLQQAFEGFKVHILIYVGAPFLNYCTHTGSACSSSE
ncbi:hypothetical protein DFH09DRAFT_1435517 [Mycena vulgaris]|nr:hypothetical protein DFH09DRAFT_1435517 [Mycena vulgaris]